MSVEGFAYIIRWSNPYTQPPVGMPRDLMRVVVPVTRKGQGAPGAPPEIVAKCGELGFGSGWALYCGAIEPDPKRLPPERLAKIRRQRLDARMRKRHPLFADEFIAEALAAKPEYYAGEDVYRATAAAGGKG